jgi:uncharacterized RDD family membrane protein YckC
MESNIRSYEYGSLKTASHLKRLLNFILDYIFQVIIILTFWVFVKLIEIDLLQNTDSLVLNYFLIAIYYIFFETVFGKTPAKYITRTKVVLSDNLGKPEYRAIMIRTLCRAIPFEALSFLFSNTAVGWHDKFSKTLVIEENSK